MVPLRYVGVVLGLLLVGCARNDQVYGNPQPAEGGTGGVPVTVGEDGGGDLFLPGVAEDVPCCFDTKPFKRLSFFTDTDVPCPAGTDQGDTLYADFLAPEQHACSCSCSEPSCTFPDGMHTNAAKCADAEGSTQLAFGPVDGWDGACSNQDPVPGGIQCGGAPCVASVTVPALLVSPCAADDPVISKTDATWGRTMRECIPDLASNGCAEGEVCPPAPPAGFDLCLHGEGDLDCPAGFEKAVLYTGVADDRGCEACTCGPPEGPCEVYVVAYSDGACGMPAGSVIATVAEPACFDVPSGIALGSVEASFLARSPGSCAPSGGAATRDIVPDGHVTLCCRSPAEAPG